MPADLSDYISSLTDFERDPRSLKPDFEKRFRLFRDFARSLDDPQDSFVSIHIAGSKGKGSVAHILASLLRTGFKKVGLYTSPHLLDVTERVRLNGRPIPRSEFLAYAEKVRKRAERAGIGLSYFEFLTFLSFLYFKDRKVDVAVYETGLGGRLDATNVLNPAAAVLTLIEKEHTDILGRLLPGIADEKLGILRKSVPVFCAYQTGPVADRVRETAVKLDCRLFEEGIAFSASPARRADAGPRSRPWPREFRFNYRDIIDNREIGLSTPMPNPVQAGNICLGLFVVRWLYPGLSMNGMKKAVAKCTVPARFELIRQNPVVIFDPCHTVGSCRALLDTLRPLYPMKRVIVYISLFRDKDARSILSLLSKAGISGVVWLENPNPRSLPFEKAKRMVKGLGSLALAGLDIDRLSGSMIHVFAGSFSVYPFIKIS